MGYPPEALIGRAFLDFVYPDDQALTTAEDARIVGGQPTTTFQNRYLHKDGRVVWFEWSAVVVPGDAAVYCVTQRRAATADQAFLAAIVQTSRDAIIGTDPAAPSARGTLGPSSCTAIRPPK